MIGTSRSGSSLFITYSSTNHKIRSGISEYTESRMIGRHVPEASKPDKFVEFSPSAYLISGDNTLEISYELFGSTEFGDEVQMSELKGVSSVRLSGTSEMPTEVESWQIQTFPPAMRGREVDPNFSFGPWRTVLLGGTSAPQDLVPAFTWCRAQFALKKGEGWSVSWKLIFEAERDALIYLNGRFVGRSVTVGPQTEFYLPEPYLHWTASRTYSPYYSPIPRPRLRFKTLHIEPYVDYSARRKRLEFEW
jgi:hypothetical protein